MINSTVGHYRVVEKIGEGGMGEVYRAEDLRLHRTVALKFLPTQLQEDEVARKRFLREARAAAALEHPYICNIKEVDRTGEGHDFIVMEYVEGQTLRERLERGGPLPVDETLRISSEIAEALQVAHARGLVHRDLKPDNIMLTPQGHAKVMDFGLAKRVAGDDETKQDLTSTVTRTGVVPGTPAYMSPEQIEARPVDPRSDLFSLGIVLYEMLTGANPFRRSTAAATLASILYEEPEPLPRNLAGSSDLLDDTLGRLLAKDPDKRTSSSEELSRQLKELTDGRKARHLAWYLRGRRGRRLSGALAGAILVSLVGWWLFQRSGTGAVHPLMSSVAVLPFENVSGNPGEDYFVTGVTGELITSLSKISALTIIDPPPGHYRDTDKSLPEIAQELNADGVITGSILREGGQVRVTARLIEAGTGQVMWADSYQRDLTNILALQAELTQAIAGQVRVTLRPEERSALANAGPVDPEAYDAYLQGVVYWRTLTKEGLDTAERYFQRALEKDSSFALAYTGLARVWGGRGQGGFAPTDEVVARGEAAARRALELDPGLAEAHTALAMILSWQAWNWEEAWPHWRRSLEINPSDAETQAFYAHFLAIMGLPEEALPHGRRAMDLNPVDAMYRSLYAVTLFFNRRKDEALAEADSALLVDPSMWLANAVKGWVFLERATPEEVLTQERAAKNPQRLEALERGLREGGFVGGERAVADFMATQYGTVDVARLRAEAVAFKYLQARDPDRAMAWFERGVEEERDPNMPYVVIPLTLTEPIRADPRFADLLRKMNFPEDAIARNIQLTG